MTALGWGLQLVALVVVGSALLIGLVHQSMTAELGMLVIGIALFLVGGRLQRRQP